MKLKLTLLTTFLFCTFSFFGQINWTSTDQIKRNAINYPSDYQVVQTDFELLKSYLETAPHEDEIDLRNSTFVLNIPVDGAELAFKIVKTDVMHPKLAAKFPEIATYIGSEINGEGYARLDYTSKGFHAWIKKDGETFYIDPTEQGNRDMYFAYNRTAFYQNYSGEGFSCSTEDIVQSIEPEVKSKTKDLNYSQGGMKASGDELRTYRLALACTGEYANFHGGTVSSVMDEFVVAMNRINGIYETEVSIRMVLVPNNDQLIFLDGSTDPYTNNNGGTMLGENIATCNSIIGSANYDVGHVFSTGGGGVAFLNAPCGGNKAGGVTGLGSPVNDPFYVDFASHEFGHQFGGRHTQNNSCQRSSSAAYEPGSASTIMGYAGICSPNLQSNSDDHFHVHSYDEIITFSQSGNGNTCATVSATGNSAPTVSVPASGFSIPRGTPFKLEGSAIDPDGDVLMYRWDEHDLGPATASGDNNLTNPSGNQPVFRSWPATSEPVRYCPQLSDLVNGTATIGEHLPDYERELSFRLVALDFLSGGGGVEYGEVTFQMTDNAGPFQVNFPNGGESLSGGNMETVTWDVSNSNLAPVNCAEVDILLSTDGGFTYPFTLSSNTANDGIHMVVLPNIDVTTARIMVRASDNIFFDISNEDFEISQQVVSLSLDAGINELSAPNGLFSCGETVNASFEFINLGSDPISSIEYEYQIGTDAPVTDMWTGNLFTAQTALISIPELMFSEEGALDFNLNIINVNGLGLDENSLNDSASSSFNYSIGDNEIEVEILTDCWGNEVTWELRNDADDVIASGGPYANQQTFTSLTECLPDGCYTFEIFDSFGDGLSGASFASCGVDGNYTVTDGFGNILAQMGDPDYGSGISHTFCLPVVTIVESNFEMSATEICQGETVDFTDLSIGAINSWEWTFDQGDPVSSSDQNSSSTFNEPGVYAISLIVSDGQNSDTSMQSITVLATSLWYLDNDGDGFGDVNESLSLCGQPLGYVENADDCDDDNNQVFPNATELCDGIDNNCDGLVDEGLLTTYYIDNDGDGYGDVNESVEACTAPVGFVENSLDCHDGNIDINPDAVEICDGLDNNCDGQIDEGLLNTYYVDNDNDGFGNPNQSVVACSLPPGFVENADDCDDSNNTVYLGAEEICGDGIDNDCDGLIEEDCSGCFPGSVPAPSGLQNQFATGGYLLSWDPVPGSIACQINGGAVSGPQVSINIFQNEPSQRFVSSSILNPGTTYQWRIRCACQLNPDIIAGPFSGYNFFTVPQNLALQDTELRIVGSESIQVYPNPAKDELYIDGLEQQANYRIYNQLGELVKQDNYESNSRIQLNLSNGIYFIHISSRDGLLIKNEKFLISNN